ncbi:MAG TPA: type 1 glutamine amidotransferase domain-containing protein [Dehalococcoidia bacterium]|jgi:protease I|nr:type 1 glutamine amidotransferase domain-containing protein [Dehalococcoidia bacterium]
MAQQDLSGMKVAILVADDFEQVEMTEPRKALDEAGAQTTLISPAQGEVQGVNHDEKGDTFKVDMPLSRARADSFDAVLLPGGALNADKLRMEQKARDFVRRIDETGKPIAVICHAPWLLASAGLVHGRTMTSYYTLQDDLRNAGAHWLDLPVVWDENWVSSRSPKDIPQFNAAMAELFAACREARPAAA